MDVNSFARTSGADPSAEDVDLDAAQAYSTSGRLAVDIHPARTPSHRPPSEDADFDATREYSDSDLVLLEIPFSLLPMDSVHICC